MAFKRNVTLLRDSITNFEKLMVEAADVTALGALEDIMLGQLKMIGVALEELEVVTDDSTGEAAEVSELGLSLNEKRRQLIQHAVDRGQLTATSTPGVTFKSSIGSESSDETSTTTNSQDSQTKKSQDSHDSNTITNKNTNQDSDSMLKMKVHATEPQISADLFMDGQHLSPLGKK